MEGRQRLGVVLLVSGLAVAAVGGAQLVGGSAPTAMQPTPAASAAPTLAHTSAPVTIAPVATAVATAAPTVAPTEDTLALVTTFFAELVRAVHDGAQETLADRLGQAVIDRYGVETCRTSLAAKEPFPEQAFQVLGVSAPAPWDYVTDDLTTTVPDAITVDANVTGPDSTGAITTVRRDLHVQVVDGVVRWFTDCGEPLSAP